jgi:hypothetical protein
MQSDGFEFIVLDDQWEAVEVKTVEGRDEALKALLERPDILGRPPFKLPTLNLFGRKTNDLSTVAAAVYGFFPYFYIKIEEFRDAFLDQKGLPVHEKLVSFASTLEATFHLVQQSKVGFQLVYDFQVLRKLDFYGYNRTPQIFLKILLYSPDKQRKIADLLQGGAVGGVAFKCYEVHFDYNVKFFRDFGSGGFQEIKLHRRALESQRWGALTGPTKDWQTTLSAWGDSKSVHQEKYYL